MEFSVFRNKLRRFTLKMALNHEIFPTTLIIRGVQCSDNTERLSGGFADIYTGTYRGEKVALKVLRIYSNMPESKKQKLRKVRMTCTSSFSYHAQSPSPLQSFYHESLLWRVLVHEHVLPFMGVSEGVVFKDSLSMVLPWMVNGSLPHYIDVKRSQGMLHGNEFVLAVDTWVSFACLSNI